MMLEKRIVANSRGYFTISSALMSMIITRARNVTKNGNFRSSFSSSSSSSDSSDRPKPTASKADKKARSWRKPDFVDRSQTFDYWTRCDDNVIEKEFQRGKLLLTVNKQPAVHSDAFIYNPTTSKYQMQSSPRLRLFDCQEIRQILNPYGLEVGTLNSALLHYYPSDGAQDADMDLRAIFGANIVLNEPPAESGISGQSQLEQLARDLGVRFMPMREAMLTMDDPAQREMLAKLVVITRWYRLFVHCPRCAKILKMKASKASAKCAECEEDFYPNISPVAITLVRDESDRHTLLVRHKGTAGQVYTCIAGFCSPGESIDQTVRREVAEEVGIECWDVRPLCGSQTWPLPTGSLMIPFVATANMDDEIQASISELEYAKWFSRENVAEALRRSEGDPFLIKLSRHLGASGKDPETRIQLRYIPPQGAIAHDIIKAWVQRKF
uniref:NAD(+) diphosphatase n=1 Tax=Globodera pallida TaxID=36090 RepID=A0A183CEC0_GLOPA